MGGARDDPPEDESDDLESEAARPQGEDAVDASLHLALSDLERILDGHEGAADAPAADPESRGADAASLDDDGEQYTIPLLDEVVIPGPSPVVPPTPAATNAPAHAPLDDDEPSVRARIAARIASEMDVIIQDRIEQAVDRARDEIRDRVRNHMDIILPEIVEELVQARRRQSRP